MARAKKISSSFEQSFMFHMIRDFFLLLLLVATVEMGIRYAVLRYDYATKEQARIDQAAQKLANDVKSIMLNSGGPLAAQTVYPILNRNFDDLGLSIAVVPSEVTVASMKASFNLNVTGLQPTWKTGPHLESVVDLTAEQFCLNCHVKAKVGDVLGSVKVGSYLDRKEAAWWSEVKLTAGALSLKILVHTILLFFLLQVRMAPLLSLRSTVSQLARGLMDLSPRAKVDGNDEFGELAQDLNHFLDRINVVVTDLDQILNKVVDASSRLGSLNRDLEQTVDGLREGASRGGDGTLQDQAAQYRALAQTLREMALLEANMQNIAQSGQQVVHRLAHAEKSK
jgi:methyl-accepting chemotaxis protein